MTYKWKNSSLANGPKKGGTTKQSTTEDKDGDNSDSSSDQNDILTWRPSFALHTNERFISLAHVPVHVTDFPVVNVHDELSSARIWQHKFCATLSANVNINYCLPIKVYYHIYTLKTYQNRNNSWKPECVLSFNMGWRISVYFIPRLQLGIKY
jgi:hypothetical protein